MNIKDIYSLFQESPLVSTDTRNIIPGSLFFALKGNNFDGNKFAIEALEKGAKYAIIDDEGLKNQKKCIFVHDTLKTLQDLATLHRKKLNIPIIAITGSNGKTTTKELVYSVLSTKYNVIATKGNLNNHIGVPLSLLNLTQETEIAIIEMGANHQGEIELLCKIALPDLGLITNVGKAHIEGFGSFEGIVKTKTELYRHLSNNNGTIFCNSKNERLLIECNSTQVKKITFGSEQDNVWGQILDSNPFLSIIAHINNVNIEIQTNLIGSYNCENIVAALCIGHFFKVDIPLMVDKIKNYQPTNMRSQYVKTTRNKIVLDAYNANPTSLILALKNFQELKAGKKVVILGDMLELGETEDTEHKNIIELITKYKFDDVVVVGQRFQRASKNLISNTFLNVKELTDSGILRNYSDFNILIKGSRGIGLEKIVELL